MFKIVTVVVNYIRLGNIKPSDLECTQLCLCILFYNLFGMLCYDIRIKNTTFCWHILSPLHTTMEQINIYCCCSKLLFIIILNKVQLFLIKFFTTVRIF